MYQLIKYFQIGQGIEVFDPSSREMLLVERCDTLRGGVRVCVAVYMMLAVCIWISNDRGICNSRSRRQWMMTGECDWDNERLAVLISKLHEHWDSYFWLIPGL